MEIKLWHAWAWSSLICFNDFKWKVNENQALANQGLIFIFFIWDFHLNWMKNQWKSSPGKPRFDFHFWFSNWIPLKSYSKSMIIKPWLAWAWFTMLFIDLTIEIQIQINENQAQASQSLIYNFWIREAGCGTFRKRYKNNKKRCSQAAPHPSLSYLACHDILIKIKPWLSLPWFSLTFVEFHWLFN